MLGGIPHDVIADPERKDELMLLLQDARNYIQGEDQPLLFRTGYEKHLIEYLSHHALYEVNQHILFQQENYKYLEFYIEHWTLASIGEKQLCSPKYRGLFLMKYFEFHRFGDSENELLLFESGMDKYRHYYISKSPFYNRKAELRLFEKQFEYDLELYVRSKHAFYNDHMKLFETVALSQLRELYASYH